MLFLKPKPGSLVEEKTLTRELCAQGTESLFKYLHLGKKGAVGKVHFLP